jgi:hypothetical protein
MKPMRVLLLHVPKSPARGLEAASRPGNSWEAITGIPICLTDEILPH